MPGSSAAPVVGIFPNDAAITRLVGALLLEQNEEWQLQPRYLSLEGLGAISDDQMQRLSAVVTGRGPPASRVTRTPPRDAIFCSGGKRAIECVRSCKRSRAICIARCTKPSMRKGTGYRAS